MRLGAVLAGFLAAALGILGYLGWLVECEYLYAFIPGNPGMMPNTAVALILAGLSLILRAIGSGAGRLGAVVADVGAALVLFLALFSGAEYLLGAATPLDTMLFPGEVPEMTFPGRPSPHTCAALAMLASSLLLLHSRQSAMAARAAETLAIGALIVAELALLGYLFQAVLPFRLPRWTGMAVPTAIGLLALALGTVLAKPESGMAARIANQRLGGLLRRRLLPYVIGIPLLIGLSYALAHRLGIAFHPAAIAAYAIALMLGSWWILDRTSSLLDRLEADRLQMEEALRQSLEDYRELLEAFPDPVVVVALDGPILLVNRSFEALFGYRREEIVGRHFEILVPERFRERHRELHQAFLREPAVRQMGHGRVLAARLEDGREIPAEISLAPTRLGGQAVVIATIRDASPRLAFEEAIRKAEELERTRQLAQIKDHLLSSFSHELKTPLSAILGYAELLADAHPGDPIVEEIEAASKRLGVLVNNLLDYNALVSGTLKLFPGEVEVAEAVELAIGQAREAFAQKGITLFKDVEKDLPPIAGDSRRIGQILSELLDNACKFTEPGASAGIRARRADGEIRIDVWDTGRGIPEADQARIWEALTQLDLGNALRKGGVGLGLPIAKRLAELHGGRITLESYPGKGSTFSVFLPIARKEAVRAEAPAEAREKAPERAN